MRTRKKVVILTAALSDRIDAEKDTISNQTTIVYKTLEKLGYTPVTLSLSLNLSELFSNLRKINPFIVFNLVEALEGSTRLLHFIPSLLEEAGVAFTGSGGSALFCTTNRPLLKHLLQKSEIPTPEWQIVSSADSDFFPVPFPIIIQPLAETTFKFVAESAVISSDEQLFDIRCKFDSFAQSPLLIEKYIEGRQISISLLADCGEPEVLPPAEILCLLSEENKPQTSGYTFRSYSELSHCSGLKYTFDFSNDDQPLLNGLKTIACDCWKCFNLRGYARIDFHIDLNNRPWVTDINANPQLTPESSFSAMARTAGYTYEGIITRILDEAYFHSPRMRLRNAS